jgi:allophanate hydrolase
MTLGVIALLDAYRSGSTTPIEVIEALLERLAANPEQGVWISLVDADSLRQRAQQLAELAPESLPLYGVPFATKDNIDFAELPTTAGCPAAAYQPTHSATVVQRLLDAGAIAIGKTNLDQFATGLVGTRSPYGVCRNSFDPLYISGGSSSGSAVTVAQGLVAFSLGTDTAGSGRVPAAFNNLVGYKPTLGRLSTQGVVPACRTLDAVSIFALTADDAALVASVAGAIDAADPASRAPQRAPGRGWSQRGSFRFGVPLPGQREFFGDAEYAKLYEAAIARTESLGGVAVQLDIEPLIETARLLYQGPWVAERYLVVEKLLQEQPDALLPVTRRIIEAGATPSARDAFRAQYKLRELLLAAAPLWQQVDVLLLPTAGRHFSIAEVAAEPILCNSTLGHYTNFVNLMDLAAVAVPAGFTAQNLPFGVSLIAPAWHDEDLLTCAARLQRAGSNLAGAMAQPLPAVGNGCGMTILDTIDIAVCGAHLSGLPLNGQLTSRGAWCVERTQTATCYRLYALPGSPPRRPGMVRVADGGVAIDIEIWRMPAEHFASFVIGIPAPLGIGRVQTKAGAAICGFLCESHGIVGAQDISHFGGWRQFLATG